jgi:hypothetical protein
MPTNITINDITGTTPFDIYICDDPITTCVYIDTINTLPYTFVVPSILDGQLSYNLKVIDELNCTVIQNLTL